MWMPAYIVMAKDAMYGMMQFLILVVIYVVLVLFFAKLGINVIIII